MRYIALDWTAIVLVIVGAINWGLVGLFDFNLVSEIFGIDSAVTNIIYVLIGLSGIYLIYTVSRATSSHTVYAAKSSIFKPHTTHQNHMRIVNQNL